jgi:uncharacterized protein YbjT (DUF2867 family)
MDFADSNEWTFQRIISAIILCMILVSGATGFIGRVLVRQLTENGYRVKVLLRPSPRTPRLPKGVPVEAAVVSLADRRGLRAAMSDVETVFHLASAESQGRNANLFATDMQGSENLASAAADSSFLVTSARLAPRAIRSLRPKALRKKISNVRACLIRSYAVRWYLVPKTISLQIL